MEQEELSLLEQYAPEARAPLLFNRLNFLRILVHAGPQAAGAKVPDTSSDRAVATGSSCKKEERSSLFTHGAWRCVCGWQVPLSYPTRPTYTCFDTYVDQASSHHSSPLPLPPKKALSLSDLPAWLRLALLSSSSSPDVHEGGPQGLGLERGLPVGHLLLQARPHRRTADPAAPTGEPTAAAHSPTHTQHLTKWQAFHRLLAVYLRSHCWSHVAHVVMLCLCVVQSWVHNLDVSGTGFIVFYEMMTGTLDLKIRAIDNRCALVNDDDRSRSLAMPESMPP